MTRKSIFNLIIRDGSYTPARIWLCPFLYDVNDISNPEVAVRAAVRDFLDSDESATARAWSHGSFNWGDVLSEVPERFFIERGVYPLSNEGTTIEVAHDEVLE